MNNPIQVENPSEENIQTTGIQTREALAAYLGVKLRYITYCLYSSSREKFYTEIVIPKSNGCERTLHAVGGQLKTLQRKCLDTFMTKGWQPSEYAHGFVPGKSIITNSKLHSHKKLVIKMDIKDFFPSITFARVAGMFKQWPFEFGQEAAVALAQICCLPTENGPIPQGAVTSPYISNMLCRQLDSNLGMLAKKRRIHYSRYADDLTFSTSEQINPKKFINEVEEIVEKNNFVVNQEKTRIMWYFQRQMVTGIIVNNQGLNVNRKYIRNTRAMLHNWDRHGLDSQLTITKPRRNSSESRPFHYKHNFEAMSLPERRRRFIGHVRGRIDFIGNVRGKEHLLYLRLKDQWKKNVNKTWDREVTLPVIAPEQKQECDKVIKMSFNELNDYIKKKRVDDPRFFIKDFKLDENEEEGRELVLKYARFPSFDLIKVASYIEKAKASQSLIMRLVHSPTASMSPVTKKEFREFYNQFQKDQYAIPTLLRAKYTRMLKVTNYEFSKLDNDDEHLKLWENEKFKKEVIIPFKKATRFKTSTTDSTIFGEKIQFIKYKSLGSIDKASKPNIHIDSSVEGLRLYTDTDSVCKGIELIMESMINNTSSGDIYIQKSNCTLNYKGRDYSGLSIIISDNYEREVPTINEQAKRDYLFHGKLRSAAFFLNALCNWYVTARFQDKGQAEWKRLNAWNSDDITVPQNKPSGFTHELQFIKELEQL